MSNQKVKNLLLYIFCKLILEWINICNIKKLGNLTFITNCCNGCSIATLYVLKWASELKKAIIKKMAFKGGNIYIFFLSVKTFAKFDAVPSPSVLILPDISLKKKKMSLYSQHRSNNREVN